MEDTSCENLSKLQEAYPDLHLEDKVFLQAGRNDTATTMDTEAHTVDYLPQLENRKQRNAELVEELNPNQVVQRLSTRIRVKPP